MTPLFWTVSGCKMNYNRQEKINRIIAEMKSPDYHKDVDASVKRRENTAIKICISVLSVFLAITLAVAAVINHYLGKVNYGDITEVADANPELMEQLDSEEEIDFEIVDYKEITEQNKGESADASGAKQKSIASNGSSGKTFYRTNSVIENKENIANSNIGKEVKKKADASIAENVKDDDLWYSDDVYNLLIAGYDAGLTDNAAADTPKFYRSDAIIIASINKVQKKVKLISLSRATYAAIPGHGNKRLNTAHAYGGASLLVETVEKNYKIKIDRYITANFDGFKNIIDALGGISLDLTKTEADFAFDKDSLPEGTYKLNGTQALRYVRLRKTDSDRTRTGRQRKVLNEIMKRSAQMNTSQKLSFLETVLPFVTTNFSRSELVAKSGELDLYTSWPMEQYIVPKKATQYQMRDGLEVIIVDWEDTTKYIHSLVYDGVKVKTR